MKMREVVTVGVLLIVVAPAFFYKLGQSSLYSFDEAWYAEVAKQVVISKNLVVMKFNQQVFTDHPPAGFWLMAVGQKIWGVNELGSRAMTAIFGLLGIVGTYLIGKEWYGKTAGWMAAAALASATWYVVRARSGNLDIFLTTAMVWVVYLAWKAKDDKRFFGWLVGGGVVLTLMKTAVPFAIVPALLVIFWKSKIYSRRELGMGVAIVACIYALWMGANMKASPLFATKYWSVGLPGIEEKSGVADNVWQVKTFTSNGLGRTWFRWSLVALGLCALASWKKKYAVPLMVVASVVGPMMLSARSRLWHMIPAYPFMLLALFGVLAAVGRRLPRWAGVAIVVGFGLWITVPQMTKNWRAVVDIQAFVSDEAVLSKKAGEYKERLYIGENFLPAAIFYSDKQVERMYGGIDELFAATDANFLLIAKEEQIAMTTLGKEKYEILATDRDKMLVRFKKY